MNADQLAQYFDHTQLRAYTTDADFETLCAESRKYHFRMVAINPAPVRLCKRLLAGTDIHVGAAIGFPLGQSTREIKKLETENALENGADVAYAKYEHKHHSAFRNFGSRVNDWMLCFMLNKPKDLFISSYFAARRFVLEEMLKYENAFPYVIGLVLRATRNIVNVTVEHRDRMVGESGYTFGKLLALWFNGFTAFSEKPLRIATMAGVGCAGLGFLYGIYTIIKKLVLPGVPIGFSALMASIMFIGGMLMLMLGLIGEYVGRMYICLNHAPQFVVREIVGGEEEESEN